jgi:hypothetical protein
MPKFWLLAILLFIAEIIVAFFYMLLANCLYKRAEFDIKSISKGIIERLFLLIMFLNNIPVALTFFGALKIATRITHKEDSADVSKFNDYYLIGNLISVLIAFAYASLCQHICEIPIFERIISM